MKILKRIFFVLVLLIGVTAIYNYPKLNIVSGYAAKNAASSNFIAKHQFADIAANDNNMPLINIAEVSTDENQVAASVYGLMERKTLCRDGLGCVLVNDEYDVNYQMPAPARNLKQDSLPFPYGNQGRKDSVFANVNYTKLNEAINNAFANNETVT